MDKEHLTGGAEAVNVSDSWAQLAIRACAESILQQADYPLRDIRFFAFVPEVNICDSAMVSGRAIREKTASRCIFPGIRRRWFGLQVGRDKGLVPAGAGRGYTAAGSCPVRAELSPDLTAGNRVALCKAEQDSFIGKALLRQHTQGLERN